MCLKYPSIKHWAAAINAAQQPHWLPWKTKLIHKGATNHLHHLPFGPHTTSFTCFQVSLDTWWLSLPSSGRSPINSLSQPTATCSSCSASWILGFLCILPMQDLTTTTTATTTSGWVADVQPNFLLSPGSAGPEYSIHSCFLAMTMGFLTYLFLALELKWWCKQDDRSWARV